MSTKKVIAIVLFVLQGLAIIGSLSQGLYIVGIGGFIGYFLFAIIGGILLYCDYQDKHIVEVKNNPKENSKPLEIKGITEMLDEELHARADLAGYAEAIKKLRSWYIKYGCEFDDEKLLQICKESTSKTSNNYEYFKFINSFTPKKFTVKEFKKYFNINALNLINSVSNNQETSDVLKKIINEMVSGITEFNMEILIKADKMASSISDDIYSFNFELSAISMLLGYIEDILGDRTDTLAGDSIKEKLKIVKNSILSYAEVMGYKK